MRKFFDRFIGGLFLALLGACTSEIKVCYVKPDGSQVCIEYVDGTRKVVETKPSAVGMFPPAPAPEPETPK